MFINAAGKATKFERYLNELFINYCWENNIKEDEIDWACNTNCNCTFIGKCFLKILRKGNIYKTYNMRESDSKMNFEKHNVGMYAGFVWHRIR
jgi:hypothetical protein